MNAITGREQEIRRLLRACQQKRRELHVLEARLREIQIAPVSSVRPIVHQRPPQLETR